MGLSIGMSSSHHDRPNDRPSVVIVEHKTEAPARPRNPDPFRFLIERVEEVTGHVIALVTYAGCTNYEGRKILVFTNTTESALRNQRCLDPHFSEQGPSPIARFEPTERGWRLARITAQNINF